MNKAKKMIFPAGVGVAFTWFSSHCGSGFATGKTFMNYFGKYGWSSLFTPMIAFLVIGVATYIMLEFCAGIKADNYKDFAAEFYTPNIKITRRLFILFWDLLGVSGAMIGAGATFAAIGEIVSKYLGLPYYVGVCLGVILILLVTVFGNKVLVRFASTLCICLIVLIVTISIIGIAKGTGDLKAVVGNHVIGEGYTTWQAWIKPGFVYAAVQMSNVNYLIALSKEMPDKKNIRIASIGGAVLNVVMMLLLGTMVLQYFPTLCGESMPVVAAIDMVNMPALTVLYNIMLFFALVTTGATIVTNVISRFYVFGSKYVPSASARKAIIAVILIACGLSLSSFGFAKVIIGGYNFLGTLAGPFILIPILILGPYRLKQQRAKKLVPETIEEAMQNE